MYLKSMGVNKHFYKRGQAMTEYLIILGLLAVASIATFSFFGQTVRTQVAGMAQEMAGRTATANVTSAQGMATSATTNAGLQTTMGTYTANATSALSGTTGGDGGDGN